MPAVVRVARLADIPAMHRLRLAVRENQLTTTVITEEHYARAIERTGCGWVAVQDEHVLGFSVGNNITGNIWALFVDPEYEGQGVGQMLQKAMLNWLFCQGLRRVWLGTGQNTRAQRFYESSGWSLIGVSTNGEALYEMLAPCAA